jgi:hypothetical protein
MTSVDLKTQLGLLEDGEVAAFRGMTIASLRNERARGAGPPYQRLGRKIFYPVDKLRAYLAASTVTPARAPSLIDGRKRRRAAQDVATA